MTLAVGATALLGEALWRTGRALRRAGTRIDLALTQAGTQLQITAASLGAPSTAAPSTKERGSEWAAKGADQPIGGHDWEPSGVESYQLRLDPATSKEISGTDITTELGLWLAAKRRNDDEDPN